MNQSSKFLIEVLTKNGFLYKRSKGAHQIYYNPETRKTAIVPVHGDVILRKVLC